MFIEESDFKLGGNRTQGNLIYYKIFISGLTSL